MSFTLRACLLGAALSICCALPASPAAAASSKQDRVERAVVKRVNALRAHYGLGRLHRSRALSRAADAKAREVAATDVLSHSSPDGTSMTRRVGRYVNARAIGETLGTIPRGGGEAAIIVRAWMNSPSHRAALLSRTFRRVGVGRRWAGGGKTVIAVDLASRR